MFMPNYLRFGDSDHEAPKTQQRQINNSHLPKQLSEKLQHIMQLFSLRTKRTLCPLLNVVFNAFLHGKEQSRWETGITDAALLQPFQFDNFYFL